MTDGPRASVRVLADQPIGEVHPHVHGHFTEHLHNCIYKGQWAEMLVNRKFAGHDDTFAGVVDPWKPLGADPARTHRGAYKGDDEGFRLVEPVLYDHDNTVYYVPGQSGRGQSQRVEIVRPDGRAHGVYQDGLGLRAGERYLSRVVLRAEGPSTVEVSLGGQTQQVRGVDAEWRSFDLAFTPASSSPNAAFAIATLERGRLWIGAASLMPADNEAGWRRDVNDLLRAIRAPIVRWPGGNFASNYHWRDGIGERDRRPVRFDRAWNAWEPNDVGIDEFIQFCRLIGTEPYLCVNTGDGTAEEAAAWVEYCNGPPGSTYGAMRAANGHPEPYGVVYWGIGNETYGNWQVGHVDAETYARECVQFARAMRAADARSGADGRRLQLLAVGVFPVPTFEGYPLWNRTVARIAGAEIDYITLHHYTFLDERTPREDEYRAKVSAPSRIADLIAVSRREIDAHAADGRRIPISFDEWDAPRRRCTEEEPGHWSLTEGVYAAGLFNVFLRNADHVTMANQTMVANVGGFIETSDTDAVGTPKYLAFMLYVEHSGPVAVRAEVESPTFDVRAVGNMPARRGEPYLDVAATRDRDGRRLWLHVVNRHPREAIEAQIDLGGATVREATAHVLTGPEPWAWNSFASKNTVCITSSAVEWGRAVSFPACSATSLELVLEGG